MHPIFKVLLRRPQLLADHAAAYAALLREEAVDSAQALGWRLLAWTAAVLGLAAFIILAGVAVMLVATLGHWHWTLALVPLTALALAVIAWRLACRQLATRPLAVLRGQIQADADALRMLGSP